MRPLHPSLHLARIGRYNIGPTATIDVLIPRNSDQLELWPMGWGLIPSWWTKTRLRLRRQGGVKSLAVCLNSARNRNYCCRENYYERTKLDETSFFADIVRHSISFDDNPGANEKPKCK